MTTYGGTAIYDNPERMVSEFDSGSTRVTTNRGSVTDVVWIDAHMDSVGTTAYSSSSGAFTTTRNGDTITTTWTDVDGNPQQVDTTKSPGESERNLILRHTIAVNLKVNDHPPG